MHPGNEMRQPASTPGLAASAPRPDQRGGSFVATVGGRDVFWLLRRLLILAARRGAARQTSWKKQRFQTYLHDTKADVAVLLSSRSLTDDRASIRFPLLSLFPLPPFSRICCWIGVRNDSTSSSLAELALGVFSPLSLSHF